MSRMKGPACSVWTEEIRSLSQAFKSTRRCRVGGLVLANKVIKLRVTVREGWLSIECMLRSRLEKVRELQGDPRCKLLLWLARRLRDTTSGTCVRGVKPIWKKGMDEGKFRFETRMIWYDHGHGRYEYFKPVESEWGPDSIFLLAGGIDIKEEKWRVSFVLG